MDRKEAIEVIKELQPNDRLREALRTLIPELEESEDERIRKFLVMHVSEWIGCIEHDLKISSKDVESEEELAMFKAGLAYLERKKEQKPAEWSEEDEKNIEFLVELLEEHEKGCKSDEYGSFLQERYDSIIDWLKSLRPQPHWKPSEEQIYSLGTVVKGVGENSAGSIAYNLKELYEELKKL